MHPIGLYVHIPFCARKCPYCDFNTYAGLDTLFQDYVNALCQELVRWSTVLSSRTISTIFLGGGTPTVLEVRQLGQIFETIYSHFDLDASCEITSEANPGTVDRARFAGLRSLGVNRLSMGAQSFQPDELRFLGRIHSAEEIEQAYDGARQAGFTNINLDFMFGLPHQSLHNWRGTLERAIRLAPEHLSLYSLIVEPNTPLFHWVQSGKSEAPDDDQAAIHYEEAMERLGRADYVQYEVSNWARPGNVAGPVPAFACQHNLIYWRNQEYLGVGPGAHSHLRGGDRSPVRGRRWGNRRPVPSYIHNVQQGQPTVEFEEEIGLRLDMGETMMLGLRLIQEGVPLTRFQAMYGSDVRQIFPAELEQMQEWGLLTLDAERVRLTRRGLMVGNQVFAAFLPEEDDPDSPEG